MMQLRAIVLVPLALLLSVPLVLAQTVAVLARSPLAKRIPMWVNRLLLLAMGVRVHLRGELAERRPLILVANHVSWLDIPVLGAIAPVRFVSKAEVARWPIIGWMAKLMRTVFIERGNHGTVGQKAAEVAEALREGDLVVIFPEGTTSDGNRVMFFKSGLLGAAREALGDEPLHVQPLSIVHTHGSGLPLGRARRHHAAYPGTVSLGESLGRVLGEGALDVAVDWGETVAYEPRERRKLFAARLEAQVRAMFGARLSDARSPAGTRGALSPISRAAPPATLGEGAIGAAE